MSRAVPAMLLVLLLGCAGLAGAPRRFDAFTIELVSGAVTEDQDFGARGDFTIGRLTSSQTLGWEPLEEGDRVRQRAEDLADATIRLFGGQPTLEVPQRVDLRDAVVDGQEAWSFTLPVGDGVAVHTTAWACPTAGVQVNLSTSGLEPFAGWQHERSLGSVRCGLQPVELDRSALTWRFRGDPRQWTAEPVDDPLGGRWRRSDGSAGLSVASSDGLIDPEIDLCLTTLRMVSERVGDRFVIDESASVLADTNDGCIYRWAGTRREDGVRVRALVRYRACRERGFVETCIVFDESLTTGQVCEGHLACAAAAR